MEIDLFNWLMVFLRVGAFLLALPFFSVINFPPTLRVALSALTALLLAPVLPPFPTDQLSWLSLFGLMVQEVGVGLLLGFMARMVFYAVDLAGNFVASELGLNTGALLDPMTGVASQAPGTILFYLAAMVMLTLNLHHWVLVGFERTYAVLPVGGAHWHGELFNLLLTETARLFVVALEIAAPVLAVSFVVTVVFGVLSRAVPQMNVFILSFSFRIVGGLIVFGFTLQLAAQHVANYLNRLPEDLLTLAQLLGTK
ncbi:MAG TPA: flagellar biosynthetic protein FliR [Verrucomicrobiae bacterium]|nr:flagellar biosynthetic protein FliR [Verrucomicrobiae bacterium]